jgi:hypothetical protein
MATNILANQEFSKKDSNTITVVKSVPVEFTFTPEYLKEQRQRIVEQKDRDNAQRDIEIAECEAYLLKCTELEVVEKPVEEVEEEVVEETPVEEPIEEIINK